MIASNSARSQAGSALTSSANLLVTAACWVASGILVHSPATSSYSTPGHVRFVILVAHTASCIKSSSQIIATSRQA
jgi:hypothetical protein